MNNYRERCSVALMRAWNRRAVVCAHTQRVPIGELVDAVLAVPNPEVERLHALLAEKSAEVDDKSRVGHAVTDAWMARAEQAEAAITRVRTFADRLCFEPACSHDHLCPDDVRRALLAAIEGTDSEH